MRIDNYNTIQNKKKNKPTNDIKDKKITTQSTVYNPKRKDMKTILVLNEQLEL